MKVLFLEANEICVYLVDAFNKKKGIFSKRVNAEDFTPGNTDGEKAQFLFWVIQMDYAMKSERLYKDAVKAWKKVPKMFNTATILRMSDKELKKNIVQWFNPRYPNEITSRFKLNADKLSIEFNGKAINIVRKAQTAKQLLKMIRTFRGFGPKLGNFLLRTYISLFDLRFKDLDDIFQPVDRHDVRLTYEWGFIDSPKMTDKNIRRVKMLWQSACKEARVSWVTFDRALWVLGSIGKRTGNPEKDFWENVGSK